MGVKKFFRIKNLNKDSDFYEFVIGEIGEKVSLAKFKGKRLCYDASHTIYQSITALESIQALTDSDGNTTVHINTIFNKIIMMAKDGIEQIWIFDSPTPNPMKKKEYARRQAQREKASKSETMEEGMKEKAQYKLNKQHVEEIQQLLTSMGIMYIVAPPEVEAEQYGAYLTKGPADERFCEYMISGDSDVLFFGGNLLRIQTEKSSTGKTSKTIYRTFDLDYLLNELGMNQKEFLKMGVAMGTDFCDKAERIGEKTVMKHVKNDDIYITPAMKATIEYYSSDISGKAESAEIISGNYDRQSIEKLLESRKFNMERVNKRLDDFEKYKKKHKMP